MEEDVKQFLNYSIDFWKFIGSRITRIDIREENAMAWYGVLVKVNSNRLVEDFHITIPYVNDLKTALIFVHEMQHAYELYNLIGKEIKDTNTDFEITAKLREKEYLYYIQSKEHKLCKRLNI